MWRLKLRRRSPDGRRIGPADPSRAPRSDRARLVSMDRLASVPMGHLEPAANPTCWRATLTQSAAWSCPPMASGGTDGMVRLRQVATHRPTWQACGDAAAPCRACAVRRPAAGRLRRGPGCVAMELRDVPSNSRAAHGPGGTPLPARGQHGPDRHPGRPARGTAAPGRYRAARLAKTGEHQPASGAAGKTRNAVTTRRAQLSIRDGRATWPSSHGPPGARRSPDLAGPKGRLRSDPVRL
jgi:hypothetical protein